LAGSDAVDDAIKEFQQVLQLNPTATVAQLQLGTLFLSKGEAAAALEFLEQALKGQPTSGTTHFFLAEALIRLGKVGRAEAEVTLLVKSSGSSPEIQRLLGDFYFMKRDMPRAREAYARALQNPPGPITALNGITNVDLIENKPDAARKRIESRLA